MSRKNSKLNYEEDYFLVHILIILVIQVYWVYSKEIPRFSVWAEVLGSSSDGMMGNLKKDNKAKLIPQTP